MDDGNLLIKKFVRQVQMAISVNVLDTQGHDKIIYTMMQNNDTQVMVLMKDIFLIARF